MTKEEFNKLSIDDRVEYVNLKMRELGNIEKVCKSLGISVDGFRMSIKNLYTYIAHYKAYIKISDLEGGLALMNKKDENGLVVMDAQEQSQSLPLATGLAEIENAQDKLISLLKNYDKIVGLIEDAQEPSSCIQSNSNAFMNLNMPGENKLKKTTIRVNECIWNEFLKSVKGEFKHLEQYDLISVAIRDFLEKYSMANK